jgi:hypothetical protein
VFKEELKGGRPSSLPFSVYVRHAVEEHRGMVSGGRWATKADGGLQYFVRPTRAFHGDEAPETPLPYQPLFYFIRLVKAHPEMASASATEALDKVGRVLAAWRHAVPEEDRYDDWYPWLAVTEDDSEAEFLDTWDQVRYFPGWRPLAVAVELSRRRPVKPSPEHTRRYTRGYAEFVSVAGWLQVAVGNANILLPVKELSELLGGVAEMTVCRYRRWAVEDGFLREVRHSSHADKRATEFRFNVARVPMLAEAAARGTASAYDKVE